MNHILLVEDDRYLAQNIHLLLRRNGFESTVCSDRKTASTAIAAQHFDLCLIDLMLPDGSGFALCQEIRSGHSWPILILSADDDEESMVKGLELGADDYITKPFVPRVLISRIRANLRRFRFVQDAHGYICGELQLDTDRQTVCKNDTPLPLSPTEYQILEYLMRHAELAVRREALFAAFWDSAENYIEDNTLTVTMSRLRPGHVLPGMNLRNRRVHRGTGLLSTVLGMLFLGLFLFGGIRILEDYESYHLLAAYTSDFDVSCAGASWTVSNENDDSIDLLFPTSTLSSTFFCSGICLIGSESLGRAVAAMDGTEYTHNYLTVDVDPYASYTLVIKECAQLFADSTWSDISYQNNYETLQQEWQEFLRTLGIYGVFLIFLIAFYLMLKLDMIQTEINRQSDRIRQLRRMGMERKQVRRLYTLDGLLESCMLWISPIAVWILRYILILNYIIVDDYQSLWKIYLPLAVGSTLGMLLLHCGARYSIIRKNTKEV